MAFNNASNFVINHPVMVDLSSHTEIYHINDDRLSPVRQITPNASMMFTGQERYLKVLRKVFVNENPNDFTRKYFVLHGMGGIGKTQICLKLMDETEDYYTYKFWIDATSDDSIEQSLKDIYKTYMKNEGVKFSSALVLNWISTRKCKWLMVFDNVDGDPADVEKFFPPRSMGNILITSRNQAMKRLVSDEYSMEVTEMNEDDGTQLLLKIAGLYRQLDLYKEVAKTIVSELYGVPLAIDHAGAYIQSGSCNITEFLEIYKTRRKRLMNNSKFRGASNYNKTVYGTFEVSLQKIKLMSEDLVDDDTALAARYAIVIINISAFLHHQNISSEMFQKAAKGYCAEIANNETRYSTVIRNMDKELFNLNDDNVWNRPVYNDAVAILISFSLIKKHPNTSSYSLHPLVQHWCQDGLRAPEKEEWIMNTIGVVGASIELENATQEYIYNHQILIHVLTILKNKDSMESHTDYVLLWKFVQVLRTTGRHDIELAVQERILDISRQVLDTEHPDMLIIMDSLASTYFQLRRFNEAEELQMKLFELRIKIFGKEDRRTLNAMSSLAVIQRNLGKFEEAKELGVQVLNLKTRVLGESDPDTLATMSGLSNIYHSLGELLDAENLETKALNMKIQILGEEHPDTLRSMSNLAVTYFALGKLEEAKELQVRTLDLSVKILGENHPDSVRCMNNLASTYSKTEDLGNARKMYARIYRAQRKTLGDNHPDTLSSVEMLKSFLSRESAKMSTTSNTSLSSRALNNIIASSWR